MNSTSTYRRLARIFAVAAAGIGLVLPASAQAQEAPTRDSLLRVWDKLQHENTVPYDFAGRHTAVRRPSQSLTIAQLESLSPGIAELTSVFPGIPENLSGRHIEAAASILKTTADRVSGDNLSVQAIARPERISDWIMTPYNEIAQALFLKADILSLSMQFVPSVAMHDVYSSDYLDTAEDARHSDDFWRRSRTLMFWCAGNSGGMSGIRLERAQSNVMQCADTLVRVGEAVRDKAGVVSLAHHTSRSGASVVAFNPFKEGFSYPYRRDEASLRVHVRHLLDLPSYENKGYKVKNFLAANLRLPVSPYFFATTQPVMNYLGSDINIYNDHPHSPEDLKRLWRSDDEIVADHIDLMAEELKKLRAGESIDDKGNMTGLSGTSFSTPHLAGLAAAMRSRHPSLSEFDINAAILIAAVPVDTRLDAAGKPSLPVEYRLNGRNIPYNPYDAGFGLVTEETLENTTRALADLQKKKQLPSSSPLYKASPEVSYKTAPQQLSPARIDISDCHGLGSAFAAVARFIEEQSRYRDYEIDMPEDIVALRAHVIMRFRNNHDHVPDRITLIDPQGGHTDMSPTRLKDADDKTISIATSDGMFGTRMKGKCIIRVQGQAELSSAQIKLCGFAPGSLVDRYLNENPQIEVRPAVLVHAP